MKTVTATEAKNRLGRHIETALREPVAIERTGRKVAVLLSWDEFERLTAADDAFWLARAREGVASGYIGASASADFISSKLEEGGLNADAGSDEEE